MNEDVKFIKKHRSKSALIDTSLLLVYVIGKCDQKMLSSFAHTKQYQHDFPLIERLVELFSTIHTTPNILTELSNLGGKLKQEQFYTMLRTFTSVWHESYYRSSTAAGDMHFTRLGLTDSAILHFAAAEDLLVVTDDLQLYLALRSRNLDAVNVNHHRPYAWQEFIK